MDRRLIQPWRVRLRFPSSRAAMFCHPSEITRARLSRAVPACLYSQRHARISQLTRRDFRNAASTPSCCCANRTNAYVRMASNDPHRKIDLISSQMAELLAGNIGCVGKGVNGGGAEGPANGGGWPNNRKGRLDNSKARNIMNWNKKKNALNRKPNNVPSTEKKPRLFPAGNRLTTTARVTRKNKLYFAHCPGKLADDTGMRRRFQWVCSDINL